MHILCIQLLAIVTTRIEIYYTFWTHNSRCTSHWILFKIFIYYLWFFTLQSRHAWAKRALKGNYINSLMVSMCINVMAVQRCRLLAVGSTNRAANGAPAPPSVKQHGAGVLVVHLLHVPEDVLLRDHAQQPPEQGTSIMLIL